MLADIVASVIEAVQSLNVKVDAISARVNEIVSKNVQNGKNGLNGKDGANGKDGKDGLNGIDGKNSKDGIDGKNGIDGLDGADGKDGKNGKDGINGKDGQDGKDGKNGTNGKDGRNGKIPEHEWSGTKLRFQQSDGNWGEYVDLQGKKGLNGFNGNAPVTITNNTATSATYKATLSGLTVSVPKSLHKLDSVKYVNVYKDNGDYVSVDFAVNATTQEVVLDSNVTLNNHYAIIGG